MGTLSKTRNRSRPLILDLGLAGALAFPAWAQEPAVRQRAGPARGPLPDLDIREIPGTAADSVVRAESRDQAVVEQRKAAVRVYAGSAMFR